MDQDELDAPKIDISLTRIKKQKRVGSGKFGDVFLGTLDQDEVVVLKAIKQRVDVDLYEAELGVLNRLKSNRGVTPFLGVAGARAFLVFGYQGVTTLEDILKKSSKSTSKALDEVKRTMQAEKKNATEEEVFKYSVKTLLESVSQINGASIVHRDIKPSNVLVAETDYGRGKSKGKRLIPIDLGAAYDLRAKRGGDEHGAIFDPKYGAPEQFETTGSGFGIVALAKLTSTGVTPTEKFDSYCCGMTVLRFGCPNLYGENVMSKMRNELINKYNNDLNAWRDDSTFDFSLLDATGVWDVVSSLCEVVPRKRIACKQAAGRVKSPANAL